MSSLKSEVSLLHMEYKIGDSKKKKNSEHKLCLL